MSDILPKLLDDVGTALVGRSHCCQVIKHQQRHRDIPINELPDVKPQLAHVKGSIHGKKLPDDYTTEDKTAPWVEL